MSGPTCRFCAAVLHHTVVDLGATPLCESYVSAERYHEAEPFQSASKRFCNICNDASEGSDLLDDRAVLGYPLQCLS